MAEKLMHRRIPVEEQPKDRLYAMSIRFVGDVGLRTLYELSTMLDLPENLTAQNAVTFRVTQTVPFIPDDKTLTRYADSIMQEYNCSKTETRLANLKFDGYDYLYPVAPISDVSDSVPDQKENSCD